MESNLLTLVLDVVLAGLLAGVIWFGLRLNRQLSSLRNSRAELKKLLEDFSKSTDRAEAALDGLKRGAHENIAAVRQEVDKAESLKDDLVFLTKRGEAAADRLEEGISQTRSQVHTGQLRSDKADRSPAEGRSGKNQMLEKPQSQEKTSKKSDLLRALQGMR